MKTSRDRQEGFAAIVAILLVAAAAAAAVSVQKQQALWARQVENISARAQADALAQAGVQWAKLAMEDRENPRPLRPDEIGARALDAMKLGDAELRMRLIDQQGLYNLNNVVRGGRASEADVQLLRRLLGLLGLPAQLADAVVDAVDADSQTTLPGGAEDLDYLAMVPPRRAQNRRFLDIAGLANVRGFDALSVARIEPYVSALPEATPINLNSAPAELLAALVPQLSLEAARSLVARRAERPFEDLADFRSRLPEDAKPAPGVAIGLRSGYYIVESESRSGPAEVVHRELLNGANTGPVVTLWRKLGG